VLQPALKGASGFLTAQVEQHLRGGDEERGVALLHRLMRDVLRDHRLAEPLRGDEDDVAILGEEVEAHGSFDGVPVDAGRPVPLEVDTNGA